MSKKSFVCPINTLFNAISFNAFQKVPVLRYNLLLRKKMKMPTVLFQRITNHHLHRSNKTFSIYNLLLDPWKFVVNEFLAAVTTDRKSKLTVFSVGLVSTH